MTDPNQLLTDFEARLAETTRVAEQVRSGLDSVNAAARSADGKVAVTVDAAGNVVDLRLSDAELAATVLSTIRRAQSRLAGAVHKSMPAELAGTELVAELDERYRTTYPAEPEPTRARSLRLGAEEERAAEQARPRKPRATSPGDDGDYGDRGLLR